MKEIVIEGSSSDLANWLRSHLPEGESEGRVLIDARFTAKVNPPEFVSRAAVDAANILCALIARGIVERADIQNALTAEIDPAEVRALRVEIASLARDSGLVRETERKGKAFVSLTGTARVD